MDWVLQSRRRFSLFPIEDNSMFPIRWYPFIIIETFHLPKHLEFGLRHSYGDPRSCYLFIGREFGAVTPCPSWILTRHLFLYVMILSHGFEDKQMYLKLSDCSNKTQDWIAAMLHEVEALCSSHQVTYSSYPQHILVYSCFMPWHMQWHGKAVPMKHFRNVSFPNIAQTGPNMGGNMGDLSH